MIVWVSGVSHSAAIATSGVPVEEGWPTPTVQRSGKGRRYRYDCDASTANLIRWHLEDIADSLDGCGDPEGATDRRALRRDAERIRTSLGV